MQITYRCPACGTTQQEDFTAKTETFDCAQCDSALKASSDAVKAARVEKCLACPSTELFVRKDFPQRLGVTIVAIGLGLSCIAWYYHAIIPTFGILFATALIDLALFLFMGDVLECYRCHAQYRGVDNLTEHEAFNLEVHEKHRQQLARQK